MKGDCDISQIDSEDRVHNIGTYNAYVNICIKCYPERVWLGNTTTIGFGTDSKFNTKDGVLPRIGERVYIDGKTYGVDDIIYLYDFGRIEVHLSDTRHEYISM